MKKRKIGYIDINAISLKIISRELPNIVFCDVRKCKHKIFDVVLHGDNITAEEKSMYELFNTTFINVDNSTLLNSLELIKEGLKHCRNLSVKQMQYISVINKFQYLNEKVEKLVGDKESHSLKVAHYIKSFCEKTYMNDEVILDLYMAALFHDIGKVFVDPKVLCKKGKLNKEEYEEIKVHPVKGYEMLKGYLPDNVLSIIKNHHKRENDSGYPNTRESASEWAKLLSISDSYDAMISERIYNTPLSREEGIQELLLCSKDTCEGGKGLLFNPYLTELFIKTLQG